MPRQPVSCGACQHFEKRCNPDVCFWAPYFPPDNPDMFIKVHNTFKASNVKRILSQINDPNARKECVRSLAYEAEVRSQDPVYGCMGYISRLEQAVANAQRELATCVDVGKNILLSKQMNYNHHHVADQHQQMMMGRADQSSSAASNYMIYGAAAGTTCQQTQIMDPSASSAPGLIPFTSVAPSQTQLIREQHDEVIGMETQENYAAVAATDDHRQNQLQQLADRGQSSHDLMQQMMMGAHHQSSSSNYMIYGAAAGTTCQQTQIMDPSASSASGGLPPFTSVAPCQTQPIREQREVIGMETQENYAAVAATDFRQELLNQLQQLAADREQSSHDLMQQQVHGRNATARSPEQHDPTTAVPKAATSHGQELLNQLRQLHSHDLLQQQVHDRNATARSPEQHDPTTAVPKAATNHRQELLNQLQQLHSHDLMQQQVHGRNATARSPEQHDPTTAVPKAAHGPGFTDATTPRSTTEIISWDFDDEAVKAALYEIERLQAEEQEEVNFSK